MDPNTPFPLPEPTEEPTPGEDQPIPAEQPKRRRMLQPVFSTRWAKPGKPVRMALTGLALCFAFGLHAQPPATPSTNPTGQQVTPLPDSSQPGWVMFDDNVGRALEMPPEQLQQLRDLDIRYHTEYRALGNDPTANPKYRELTERRDQDIRKLMDDRTWTNWQARYSPVPNTIQEQRTGNTHTTTPTPPKP